MKCALRDASFSVTCNIVLTDRDLPSPRVLHNLCPSDRAAKVAPVNCGENVDEPVVRSTKR